MPLRAVTALAAVLLLAGCAPAAPQPSSTPTEAGSKPTATATATATPAPSAPETVDAATYLIDGTPFVPDGDGNWKGHYAFFTDDLKTVRCDIYIYSGDSGGVTCTTTGGNEDLVTYAVPAAQCDPSLANPFDGYSVAINFKVFDTGNAGFSGCGVGEALADDGLPTPLVLHDGQTLFVNSPLYQYTCAVSAGAATCTDSYSGASITYGLAHAAFTG